jgi:hypothetical protein
MACSPSPSLPPVHVLTFQFLFYSYLGDGYQSEDRTAILRKLGYPSRRLGPIQMTTGASFKIYFESRVRGF